jgi:N-acetylglucosamine-6-phosphate deacetylase
MDKKYYIKNIINHDKTFINHVLYIRDDKISDIRKESSPDSEKSYCYAIPGFIDMHTHGGGGKELMDNSIDALNSISRFYLHNGTTSFLTSTVTSDLAQIDSVLKTVSEFIHINEKMADKGMQAKLLGVHLEGPWLSKKNIGAQNPDYCIVPDEDSLKLIVKFQDIIKMVTFSYHTPESEKLLELLVEKKIIPACGHDESYDEMISAGFKKGIKVITHIYCVTSMCHKRNGLRHLGTTEMGLMTDGIKVEVIADEKHITKYFWDFIRHNKKFEDIIIVSDSIRCTGIPADPKIKYKVGDINVIIDDGVAWLEDKSVFAGSIATMCSSFRTIVKQWNVNINDAVRITSYNQAILLNLIDRVGEIMPGKIADILLFDQDLNLQKVIKSGSEVVI